MTIFFIGALVILILILNKNNYNFKCRSPLILIALFSAYYLRFSIPIILEIYFFYHFPLHIIARNKSDNQYHMLLAIQSIIIGSIILIILLYISRSLFYLNFLSFICSKNFQAN